MSKQQPDWYDPKLFRGRKCQTISVKFSVRALAKASARFLTIALGVVAVLLETSRFV